MSLINDCKCKTIKEKCNYLTIKTKYVKKSNELFSELEKPFVMQYNNKCNEICLIINI